eukprot:m.51126 g.51126  ORF g.51126 m.51126 type:complete len:111 (-) comp12200_c0_seq2:881-1213(-)
MGSGDHDACSLLTASFCRSALRFFWLFFFWLWAVVLRHGSRDNHSKRQIQTCTRPRSHTDLHTDDIVRAVVSGGSLQSTHEYSHAELPVGQGVIAAVRCAQHFDFEWFWR